MSDFAPKAEIRNHTVHNIGENHFYIFDDKHERKRYYKGKSEEKVLKDCFVFFFACVSCCVLLL